MKKIYFLLVVMVCISAVCWADNSITAPCDQKVYIWAQEKSGYIFLQWNDGNTENPRLVTISDAGEYIAEFAPGGKCGDHLTWALDVTNQRLIFVGEGAMYNYGATNCPWYGYKGDINTLILPDGITSIGTNAFAGCTNLTKVILEDIDVIGDSAFVGCTNLSTLKLLDVDSIGENAFSDCMNLTSVTMENVGSIGRKAFKNCQRMVGNIDISRATEVGDSAFYNCYFINSVQMGSNATQVGANAFANCVSLTSFACNAVLPPTAQANSFTNVSCPLYVPCNSANVYRINTGWNSFSEISGASNYVLRANSSNSAYGMVNITAKPNCSTNAATVQANTGTDCRFLRWEDAEHNLLSKMNPYSLTLNRDTTIYGIFTTDAGTIGGTSSSDKVMVETTTSTAAFTWPQVEGAEGYTLVIWSDAEQTTKLITLTFNAAGYLINIDFAQHAPMRHTGEGLNFTVTGLEEEKHYGYSLYSQEDTRSVIDVKEGDFVTKSNSGLEFINTDDVQFFLLKGTIVCDKEFRIYDVVGRDVTRYNGNLQGVYLVRIGNVMQKVVVK